MSDKLLYSDIFDFSDESELEKGRVAIDAFEKQYSQLSKNLIQEAARIGIAQRKAVQEFQAYEKVIRGINTATEAGQSAAKKVASDVDKQAASFRGLRTAQKGVEASNKSVEGSLNSLRQKLKEQRAEFTALSESADPAKLRALAVQINETRIRAEQLENATRGVNSIFTAAKGSYNALTTENRKLSLELKNLAGTQLENGQRTQESIARETELKKRIAANTAQLKSYDAQLNQHFRNVGNYADSIIQAVNALNSQKAALVQQEAALKRQQAAVKGDIALQDKLQAELTETRSKLSEVNTSLAKYGQGAATTGQQVKASFAQAGNSLKSFAATMAIATFGIAALVAGFSKVFTANAEYSDQLASVRKTTGFTADEIENLADNLKKLDTRTDFKALVDLARVGGQLGIAKEDIEGFTRALDVASVALSDDFSGGAEQIATEIGKINAIFKNSKEIGIEQSILNIGSAVNELGAAGVATAPFITDFAQRVGQAASNAGLGLDKVLGLGAAFEELGFSAEVAGTATNRLLGGLAGNSSKFFAIAKLADANLTLKEFKGLINNDVSKALKLFLTGLNNGGAATTDFAVLVQSLGLKSGGAVNALTALAKNTQLVAQSQEIANKQLREGTSLAAEAELKNNTLGASWDKLKNSVSNALTGGATGNFFKRIIDGTRELIEGRRLLYGELLGVDTKIADKKPVDDYGESIASTALSMKYAAQETERLYAKYVRLRDIAKPTAAEQAKLQEAIAELRLKVGESAVTLNAETKQYDVNTASIEKNISKKRADAQQSARTLAKRVQSLTTEIDSSRALETALKDQLAAQERLLKAKGIDPANLKQLENELKLRKAIADNGGSQNRIVGGRIATRNPKVSDTQLDALSGSRNLVDARNDALSKIAAANKKAGEAEATRKRILENLSIAGFDQNRVNELLVESTKDNVEANLDDANTLKEQAKAAKEAAAAAKELAKSQSELAQSQFELNKFRAENKEKTFERQAGNVANDEEFRTQAAQKAADQRRLIADLEQNENIRRAQENAKDLINGDSILAVNRQLISEQYAARIKEIERDLSKEELEIHNQTANALAEVDKFRLETENNALQRIYENELINYSDRRQAAEQLAKNQVLLASLAYDAEVRGAQGSTEKIKLAYDKLSEELAQIELRTKSFDATQANDALGQEKRGQDMGLESQRADFLALGIFDQEQYEQGKRDVENKYLKQRFENLKLDKDTLKQGLDEELAYYKKINDEKIESDKNAAQKRQEILEAGLDLAGQVGAGLFDIAAQRTQNELDALTRQKESELAVVGDNDKARSKIEADFEARQAKLRRKQAIQQRAAALFEIAINTGIAVSKAVAESPLTFGLPWSAFALANGLIQAGLVLAKPLPQFFKGTESSPEGLAQVAERGPEMIEKNGRVSIVERPSVVYLQRGSKVYTAEETKRKVKQFEASSTTRSLAESYQRGERMIVETQAQINSKGIAAAMASYLGPEFENLGQIIKKKEFTARISGGQESRNQELKKYFTRR